MPFGHINVQNSLLSAGVGGFERRVRYSVSVRLRINCGYNASVRPMSTTKALSSSSGYVVSKRAAAASLKPLAILPVATYSDGCYQDVLSPLVRNLKYCARAKKWKLAL